MSTSKQNRAKRRVARARHKKVRQFPITVDIECRMSAAELGTRMHQEIEKVMIGHYHVGDSHIGGPSEQVMAYARLAGIDEVMVISGGDMLHGDGLHGVNDIYAFDYKLAQEALDDAMRSVLRAIPKKETT
jgi:hypothetical protein